ncbi:MAG: DNA phosphorothioation-associated putative methyltransferase [Cyanobacteria bacterium RI_101]|nr:DNA phosphorothioation-associated putative methyltransferase [Cyanobacteria bacterium RI_101]
MENVVSSRPHALPEMGELGAGPVGKRLPGARLATQRIELAGHALACPLVQENRPQIQRHRAALPRKTLSRPLRLALEAGLLPEEGSFFDYGCGQGQDQREMTQRGYPSAGWDPHYAPSAPRVEADLVNLGYVLNVIEDPRERREALLDAWHLTRQVLIVSAQVLLEDEKAGWLPYGDGVVTRRQTFQKYYEQLELKSYIEQVLGTEAWALGLGVYVVFRSPEQAQTFQLSRRRRRATTPRPGRFLRRFEDYEPLLRPLMAFYGERGRLPQRGELPEEEEILCVFGNYRRAFALILQATPAAEWDAIQDQRRQELLLYLALSRFEERPRPRQLPPALRRDLKELLGGYEAACLLADGLLYGLRDLSQLAALSQTSPLGKCFKQSFLIHVNYLDQLPLLLRLYEGCASQTAGRLEGANVVKLSFREPRVSYLVYPQFDALAHPPLTERLDVAVNRLRVSYRDYRGAENPPILHEKDRLVGADYGGYAQFARLSRQEWERGLLDDYGPIRRREGWERRLAERCCQVRGHRLCWRSDGDPLKLKYLKAEAQRRRRDGESARVLRNVKDSGSSQR